MPPSNTVRYRGSYLPKVGEYRQDFIDADSLNALPNGAIFVIQPKHDGGPTLEEIAKIKGRR